jgi:hypothetical protein
LASHADPFKTVMESPELLSACLKLFAAKRDMFADFLVDDDGNPVPADDVRLKCGRSVNQVIGMAVRQGIRSYAELYFGDTVTPPKAAAGKSSDKAPATEKSAVLPPRGWFKLIDVVKLAALFRSNFGSESGLAKNQTNSGRFYMAIKDSLDFQWQVQFFPIYVRIPSHVFEKLGVGITRMYSEERLIRLAQLAMADINKAESVLKDPVLFREMMDHNVLASAAVGDLGDIGFKEVHGALGHMETKQKWDVLANRETAVRLFEDKRITKLDIAALSDYLHMLNEDALTAVFDLKLPREQMQVFFDTAEKQLGQALFMALFGPVQKVVPDDPAEKEKLQKYQKFAQNALRSMVGAVKLLRSRKGNEKSIAGAAAAAALSALAARRHCDVAPQVMKWGGSAPTGAARIVARKPSERSERPAPEGYFQNQCARRSKFMEPWRCRPSIRRESEKNACSIGRRLRCWIS